MIRLVVTIMALVMLALAPSAGAAEVGECVIQKPGAYSDSACRLSSGALNHEWQQLTDANAAYTDGHPEILGDEPQTFAGEGVTLHCKGQVVVGEVTSFTTNSQFVHDYKCELLAPFRAKCGNVAEDQIDTLPEEGVYLDGEGTVLNRLTVAASFTCGGLPASIEGEYTGLILDRSGIIQVNKRVHRYNLQVGEAYGPQALTLTVGLQSWPVTLSGEQEDKLGSAYAVIETAR